MRLRLDPESATADALRAGVLEVDGGWDTILAAAAANSVAPLLYQTIGKLDVAPPAVVARMRQHHRLSAVQNLLLLRELGRCLRAIGAHNVEVIVLKGAMLAEVVYGNAALRPMADVDVLIRHRDLSVVRQALEGLGYEVERAETHPGVLAEHENELAFRRLATPPTMVDVHWSLFDSPYYQDRIPMDWFWETAASGTVAGQEVLLLGPEALLLHLCGHLALHHTGSGLLWQHDIAEVLSFYAGEIDWRELLVRTQQFGLVLPVRDLLGQIAQNWGAPVPDFVLRELETMPASPDEQRLFEERRVHQPAGRRFWSDLTSMSDWRQRLSFAHTNLFPSVGYMQARYGIRHRWLVPVYYPYRWLRGVFGRD